MRKGFDVIIKFDSWAQARRLIDWAVFLGLHASTLDGYLYVD